MRLILLLSALLVPAIGRAKSGGMTLAEGKGWWSFQSIAAPPLPVLKEAAQAVGVDAFIAAKLESKGLAAAPAAERRALMRRVTYDLIGLPPTYAEVEAFLRDEAPGAFSRVVERLLASPQYGEHWGRHWLDVVRYADTAGETADMPLPHMWRYRNWVFDALNRDLPYDEFVRLQLAGDILRSGAPGAAYTEGVVATGYLALARRFGFDTDKDIHLMHEDVIDNTGKTFLGLTISCARCHDHKYDPVTARDYYALYGIFASTRFSYSGCEKQRQPRDLVPLLSQVEAADLRRPWLEKRAGTTHRLEEIAAESAKAQGTVLNGVQSSLHLLAAADVNDGGSVSFGEGKKESLEHITLKKGELLHLAILPLGSHGADTTRVEWEIIENGGMGRRWSVSDLIPALMSGNPHPGTATAPAQWVFMDWRNGPGFLSEKVEVVNGLKELQAWRNGDTPSVIVNASDQPVQAWTTLPPRAFFMHPGPNIVVGLEWVSPLDGEVSVTGRITDAHPGGPDGVGFRLEHIAAPEAGPALVSLAKLNTEQVQLTRQRDADAGPEPMVPVAFAVTEGEARNYRLQERGDPEKPGEEVPRHWLTVLGGDPVPPGAGSGRRELAEWIVRSPLSTRVIVNRVWQWHFGEGLVRTPSDFGSRGELPSHPELLEWLCAQFDGQGRSLKALHRLILASAAYQRSSAPNAEQGLQDADHRWLSHFPRRRLAAEEIRDSLLMVGGNLDLTPGTAHPFPPEQTWNFSQHAPFSAVYDNEKRTVYQMVQRQRRHPFLALFDGADPNAGTAARQLTTAPTQALYFLNDPFFHAQAQRIVTRFPDVSTRLGQIHQVLFQRDPTSRDQARADDFLAQYPGTDEERWSAWVRVLLASNEFLHLD